jgi:hypothetical protein
MNRWNTHLSKTTDNPVIDAFLSDIVAVCKKHKLSLSHEDGHGAFEVTRYDDNKSEWLLAAHDATDEELTCTESKPK